MNFKRIMLTIGMTMLVALLTACGNTSEELETPAVENELSAVTEEMPSPEDADDEAEAVEETDTVSETGETVEETVPETGAFTETETESPAAPVQDGSWARGVWRPEDLNYDELIVFMPNGVIGELRDLVGDAMDGYMESENGELSLTEYYEGAYGGLVELTKDEDKANFRIYTYAELLEEEYDDEMVYYILDKDGRLYSASSFNSDYTYRATSDTLTAILVLNSGEEEAETMEVEVIDNGHVLLTEDFGDETETMPIFRVTHLDALVNYLTD